MICWYRDSIPEDVNQIYNFPYDMYNYLEAKMNFCRVLKEISASNNFDYCMH